MTPVHGSVAWCHWAVQHASGRRTAQLGKLCTRCQPLCAWNSYLRSVEGSRATRWTLFFRSQSSRACVSRAALAGGGGGAGAFHRVCVLQNYWCHVCVKLLVYHYTSSMLAARG